jgi:hypothetical protein
MIPVNQAFSWCQTGLAACVCMLSVGCGPPASRICQQHQEIVWDAAGSYYLENRMKPEDLIDPQRLRGFFGPDGIPRCPLGTNDYAPFKLFDGPRCPHEGSRHSAAAISQKIQQIKQNTG